MAPPIGVSAAPLLLWSSERDGAATMIDRALTARKRLLRCLALAALHRASGLRNPWRFQVPDLIDAAVRNWNEELIRLEIEAVFLAAR